MGFKTWREKGKQEGSSLSSELSLAELAVQLEKLTEVEKISNTRKGRTNRLIPSDWSRERELPPGRKRGRTWVRGQSGQSGKQEDGQRRPPCLGDRDKPTAPFEDRLSWVTESPTAFQVVPPQHMLANGDNPPTRL